MVARRFTMLAPASRTLLCARSLCCGLEVQSVDLLEELAVIPLAHVGPPLSRTGRKWSRRGRCVWTRLASSGSRCGMTLRRCKV